MILTGLHGPSKRTSNVSIEEECLQVSYAPYRLGVNALIQCYINDFAYLYSDVCNDVVVIQLSLFTSGARHNASQNLTTLLTKNLKLKYILPQHVFVHLVRVIQYRRHTKQRRTYVIREI
jgi:hypothetical protein